MVDACERAVRLVASAPIQAIGTRNCFPSGAVVYSVGDGKFPLSAACLCLFQRNQAMVYHSIDPLMYDAEKVFEREIQMKGKLSDSKAYFARAMSTE